MGGHGSGSGTGIGAGIGATVTVELGDRRYDVRLEQRWAGLGAALVEALPGQARAGRCALVSNPVVEALYRAEVEAELAAAGWEVRYVGVPDGEANKTLEVWAGLVGGLIGAGVDRRTPVLALGGGVTGDMAGFAAATALRGVPLVQLPTTLLAMVDASVGGKTGVNVPEGKNLVGAFWQPALVWAALGSLATLPAAELRCGLGEVVKHAVIAGDAALARCEELADRLRAREPEALAEVVASSVREKARIVALDEREGGLRAILNLGHTLGHGLEAVVGYGRIAHGEAVVLGMIGVLRYARARGWLLDAGLPGRVERLAERLELPCRLDFAVDRGALARAVGYDKKRTGGMLSLVIPEAAGRVCTRPVMMGEVPALVEALLGGE